MHKIKSIIKIFTEKHIVHDTFIMAISFAVYLFQKRRHSIIISERGNDARDNGLYFFKYIKSNHSEIEAYYIIDTRSADYKRVSDYEGCVIGYRSFRHYLMCWHSDVLISTHIHGFAPNSYLSMLFNRYFHIYGKRKLVSLKHGITKDWLPVLQYKYSNLDLVICGAKPEYEYVKANYGYPEIGVQYTGFCRFDGLHNIKVKNQVLVMPTWRYWLNADNFLESEYFKNYQSMLSNPELQRILEEMDTTLVFYPHHEIQPFIHYFRTDCEKIIIADKANFDVQQLLKESKILVTDYSSVFFDFAYMKKPVIFYHFDYEKYRSGHYVQGYFNYENSFGPVVSDPSDLIEQIRYYILNDRVENEKYKRNIDTFFPINDAKNCERVFWAINELSKH